MRWARTRRPTAPETMTELLDTLAAGGLTLAVEAASERLRKDAP